MTKLFLKHRAGKEEVETTTSITTGRKQERKQGLARTAIQQQNFTQERHLYY